MLNTNKQSIKDILSGVKQLDQRTVTVQYNGKKFSVKKYLTLEETLLFVNNVTSMCFDEDTGEYHPEYKDIVLRECIISYYTDMELCEHVADNYSVIYGSELIETILNNINKKQYDEILDAINKKIEHMAQCNIEALTVQLNNLINDFQVVEEKLSKTFNNISNEDINKVLSVITSNSFNEKNIVNAVIPRLSKTGQMNAG